MCYEAVKITFPSMRFVILISVEGYYIKLIVLAIK